MNECTYCHRYLAEFWVCDECKPREGWAPDYDVPENVSPIKPLPLLARCVDCREPIESLRAWTQVREGHTVSPLCDGCCTPTAEKEATPTNAEKNAGLDIETALAALVSEHAPHGFDGFMRSAKDGCQVYVAAAALQDALRECVMSSGEATR